MRTIHSVFSHIGTKLGLYSIVFISLATLAVSARAWLLLPPPSPSPQDDSTAATQDTTSSTLVHRGPVQTIRFALHDAGILPNEAHAQKGLISIAMEDLSGGSEGLVVERETGNAPERVTHVRRGEHYGRGRETLELMPGTYQVWDASRPENRATLIIEP